MREATTEAAHRTGVLDLGKALSTAAPAEFNCEHDPDDRDSATVVDAAGEFGTFPIDEAMSAACAAEKWLAVATLLARVGAERPPGAIAMISRARSALLARREIAWMFDDSAVAYESIFPMLTPEQRWDFVRRAVTDSESQSRAAYVYSLASNLDDMCRLSAILAGKEDLQAGLDRLLTMHELWLEESQVLRGGRVLELPAPESGRRRWPEVFLRLLFELLEADEQAYVQTALRGITQLLDLDDDLDATLAALAAAADPDVQRRFLLIAESLASRPGAVGLRVWLRTCMDSPRLDIALAAWHALRHASRALGQDQPEWRSPATMSPLVVPVARPLLSGVQQHTGLVNSVARAALTVLQHLEEATGDQVGDLSSELAASLRDSPPSRVETRREPRYGHMTPNRSGEAELDRLFRILRVREQEGRISDTPGPRLAQALLPFADSFVFLRTPRPSANPQDWPVDEQLDALMLSGENALRDALSELLVADLAPSIVLIAGTLRTFSPRQDVTVSVDHVVYRRANAAPDRRGAVLNGRSSFVWDLGETPIAQPAGRGQAWLTQLVGGLMPFADGTLDFFPTRLWKESLTWEPDPSDPLSWNREGRRVAWFERLHGPIRRIYPQDYFHRQPTLGRWVCLAAEWGRCEQLIGPPVRRIGLERAALRRG